MKHRLFLGVVILFCVLVFASTAFGNAIDSVYKYAWSENLGWINFGTPEGGVDVGTSELTGYAWSENAGWISLNCSNTSSCATVDYGVDRSVVSGTTITLSGYAWGENIGWVSFNCSNTSSCATVNYGVTADQTTGIFSGYAWGENIGWVSFNCSNTSSCATVDYKVMAVAPLVSGGTGGGGGAVGGGGGGSPPPAPSSAPTPTPTPTMTVTPTPTPGGIPGVPLPPPPGTTPVGPPTTATPTAPPPFYIPPTVLDPILRIIDRVGQALDQAGRAIFGGDLPSAVTIGAGVAVVVALIPIVTAIIAMIAHSEIAGTVYYLLQIVGLRRKTRIWGVVYDSRTKRPVPLAKLQLLDASGRVMETRFSDRDGRYGFLSSPGSLHVTTMPVRIVASKDGYQFPTRQQLSGTDFVVYEHLYKGETLEIREDSVLNFNIPMDPLTQTPMRREWGLGLTGVLVERLLDLGFYIGLFLVPFNYYRDQNAVNLAILIIFFGANALRIFVIFRPYGVISEKGTGKVMPFALVTLNDTTGMRKGFAVADEHGRYFLPAERGKEYELKVYTPANIQPQRSASVRIRAHSRTSRRAWVTLNVKI